MSVLDDIQGAQNIKQLSKVMATSMSERYPTMTWEDWSKRFVKYKTFATSKSVAAAIYLKPR